ncbi:MAG: hypothetical protein Q9190_006931, partial [Brigantiaea leucoxantha]
CRFLFVAVDEPEKYTSEIVYDVFTTFSGKKLNDADEAEEVLQFLQEDSHSSSPHPCQQRWRKSSPQESDETRKSFHQQLFKCLNESIKIAPNLNALPSIVPKAVVVGLRAYQSFNPSGDGFQPFQLAADDVAKALNEVLWNWRRQFPEWSRMFDAQSVKAIHRLLKIESEVEEHGVYREFNDGKGEDDQEIKDIWDELRKELARATDRVQQAKVEKWMIFARAWKRAWEGLIR